MGDGYAITAALEQEAERARHELAVLDDENVRESARRLRAPQSAGASSGTVKWNRLPEPSSLSTQMRP
jgi:hypothetical protein